MGNCEYCGKPAGLFKSRHDDCALNFRLAQDKMVTISKDTVLKVDEFPSLTKKLLDIANSNYVPIEIVRKSIIQGFSLNVNDVLEQGYLSEEQETMFLGYKNFFSLTQIELDSCDRALSKLVQAATLREVAEGKIPDRVDVNLPFILPKGESIIWAYPNRTEYYHWKKTSYFEGGSAGISLRIVKGLWIRESFFRGHHVDTEGLVHVDTGSLAITNKSLYYSGAINKFRIKFEKIIEFMPYSDGVGIQRDSSSAKPEIFITGYDGWFIYNLVTNLAKL